jgi:hypothetical protein
MQPRPIRVRETAKLHCCDECAHRIDVAMEAKRGAQTGVPSYRRAFACGAATEFPEKSHGAPYHPPSGSTFGAD